MVLLAFGARNSTSLSKYTTYSRDWNVGRTRAASASFSAMCAALLACATTQSRAAFIDDLVPTNASVMASSWQHGLEATSQSTAHEANAGRHTPRPVPCHSKGVQLVPLQPPTTSNTSASRHPTQHSSRLHVYLRNLANHPTDHGPGGELRRAVRDSVAKLAAK